MNGTNMQNIIINNKFYSMNKYTESPEQATFQLNTKYFLLDKGIFVVGFQDIFDNDLFKLELIDEDGEEVIDISYGFASKEDLIAEISQQLAQ